MNKSITFYLLGMVILAFALVGCRESQQQAQNPSDINIDLRIDPQPAAVGDDTTLFITVTHSDDTPVENASISIRGDMNHAGMMPVLREPEEISQVAPGEYTTPFEWTMGGEWFVVVNVTLDDDTRIMQEFDLSVEGDGPDMGEMDMEMPATTEEAQGTSDDG